MWLGLAPLGIANLHPLGWMMLFNCVYIAVVLACITNKGSKYFCCDRKARAASAPSFTLWQQATVEVTRRDNYCCLFAPYTNGCYSSHTYRSWWIAHSPPGEQRSCNNVVNVLDSNTSKWNLRRVSISWWLRWLNTHWTTQLTKLKCCWSRKQTHAFKLDTFTPKHYIRTSKKI